jgi:hypothetical protein
VLFHGGLVGQYLIRRELLLRGKQRRLGRFQRGLGVRDFLARDRAGAGNRLAAAQVIACLGYIGIAQCHVRSQRGVVHIERAHFTHGLRELGFGLFHGHLRVGAVELDQRLASSDELRVVGGD